MQKIDLQPFADGEDINRVLAGYGCEVDVLTEGFVNQAASSIRFLLTLGFMTHEEGQTVFARVLKMIQERIREK